MAGKRPASAEPLRICHLTPSLGRGGAERQLVAIATHCDPDRFRHEVAFLHPPADFAAELRAGGCDVAMLTMGWPRAAIAAARRIRAGRGDLIHTWQFEADVVGRLTARLAGGRPLVVSLQAPSYDLEAARAAGWPVASVRRRLRIERASMLLAKPYFVACSEHVARSSIEQLRIPPERIETIPNAVNARALLAPAGARADIRARLGIAEDALLYLNVGRLDPQKNQRRVVEAFAGLRLSPPPLLALAGDGPLAGELRQLATRLDVGDRVLFLGQQNDIPGLLAAADVFVFPSHFEGLGVAVLEAMAAGLPCIVSRAAAFAEIVVDGVSGLAAPADDEIALGRALAALGGDPDLRARLGGAAREQVASKFDLARTIPRWEDVYERVGGRSTG